MTARVAAAEGPFVTIGISTFNRVGGTFPEALRSALAQTYARLEVVVSDNASDDGTEAFMATQHDPRLRYHRNPVNIGANANFNACLEHARGTYFLLLHDDDVLHPTFVARAVSAIGSTEPGVALGGTKVIDGSGRVLSRVPAPDPDLGPAGLFLAWFDRRTSFYLFSTLFHTQRLLDFGGFASPENMFQDVVAIARLVSRFGYVSVPGDSGAFRRHEANLGSTGHALRWARDAEFLLELLCAELPGHADRLWAAGAPYMAAKSFRYVPSVRSPTERWRLYRDIDRRFGHSYAPWRFVVRHHVGRLRTLVGGWRDRVLRLRRTKP